MEFASGIAFISLLISAVTCLLIAYTAYLQRKHNRLSVKPVCHIHPVSYKDLVGIYLRNTGLGPMEIISLRIKDNNGKEKSEIGFFLPWLDNGPIEWNQLRGTVDGEVIEQGKQIRLFIHQSMTGPAVSENFLRKCTIALESLSNLSITVVYKDFYNKRMKPYSIELSFFKSKLAAPNVYISKIIS